MFFPESHNQIALIAMKISTILIYLSWTDFFDLKINTGINRSTFDVFYPLHREYFIGICTVLFCGMYDLWIITEFLGILLLNFNHRILGMKRTNNRLLSFNIFSFASLGDCLYGLPVKRRTPPCHCGSLLLDTNIRKKLVLLYLMVKLHKSMTLR